MNLLSPPELSTFRPLLKRFFDTSATKIRRLQSSWDPAKGSPVFTVAGKYSSRGWTEWTQGFQFGMQALQFDATGESEFLRLSRENTVRFMAPHVSHIGVHDHGFNNVSTYGNLRRLALEGKFEATQGEIDFFNIALKVSGAVQASRWTRVADGTGYIFSFNGPHSLFSDTIRSCRSLMVAHKLGHAFLGEGDVKISLLQRAIEHIRNTIRWNVFYGEGRDSWDIRGRVAHEGIFDTINGVYRCPSTQQGYSAFSTWTRGLAWVLLGVAEEVEFLRTLSPTELAPFGGLAKVEEEFLRAGRATADFLIDHTCADGIPFWDTGAPGVATLKNPYASVSNPANDVEPMDSSASAIAAQGYLRLATVLGSGTEADRYRNAGLIMAKTLFSEPYLSVDPAHEGLILHAVYHRPNNWDHIPAGAKTPYGESCLWGDYHAMELAVYLQRELEGKPRLTFFHTL